MSNDPENFSQHFRDSWDQTVGAWVSIFKGVRGASKVAAKGTKETISSVYEDSKAEAIINISKDLVKTTAHGSTAAVGIIVEKGKEVTGLGGRHADMAKVDTDKHGGLSFLSNTPQMIFIGVVVGVVVVQTGYIVYLCSQTKKVDKPAPKWQNPNNLRSTSPTPSPQPMAVFAADEVPLGEEEEDRRLAASEARYRKDMDMESLDSESF